MALIIGLTAILSTFLGGLFAVRLKDKLHLITGFSAGAVIGVAFFDLLPESINLATKSYSINLITLLIAIGFTTYLILDRFFSIHCHDKETCENPSHSGNLGASALIFHSFLDGLGIGLAFKVSPAVGFIVASAVLAHNFSDGINTVTLILKNRGTQKAAIKYLVFDALAPLAGVIVSLFFSVSEANLGLILALFTGLFIYIGASELIPESHHRHPTIWTTIMTVLGILVLYIVIRLAG